MTDKTKNDENDGVLAKITELEEALLKAQEDLASAEESKLRSLAELQNYQRRQATEKAQWSQVAVVGFLRTFLPRFLELQLGAANTEDTAVAKTIETFFASLQKEGLTKIEPSTGDKVDPDLHEVLMQGEGEPGTIVSVLEPGWQYGEITIAPAKVSGAPEA